MRLKSATAAVKSFGNFYGDGFFQFLPSFKKRVDTEDGFTNCAETSQVFCRIDDLVPYSVVSGKVSEYPYHIEFRFTITPREATEYAEFTAWLTGFAEKVPLCTKVFADKFDEYVERLLSQLSQNMRTAVLSVLEQILICVCSH